MKKTLITFLATLTFGVTSTAFGWSLSWESFTGMGNEVINPVSYNIEVNGNNLRVYEWVTPTEPTQKCVFVASEHNTNFQCSEISDHSIDDVFDELNEE